MTPVWVYVGSWRERPWCVLTRAVVGGRISTLCIEGDGHDGALEYGPVMLTTEHPGGLACAACDRELAAGTTGAATAGEPPCDDPALTDREVR